MTLPPPPVNTHPASLMVAPAKTRPSLFLLPLVHTRLALPAAAPAQSCCLLLVDALKLGTQEAIPEARVLSTWVLRATRVGAVSAWVLS